MALCSEPTPACVAVLGLSVLLGLGTRVQGEMCYSKHSGFSSCSNGCCGPDDNQNCCSQIFLILGLAIGAAAIGVAVVVVVLCWLCKDCRPKPCRCCRGGRGRGERGRRERHDRRHGRHSTARRVLVHPVQPPDYSTATQERAPSVQPGLNPRHLPLSPPPPYTEAALSSPNPAHQGSPRAKLGAVAAPATASPLAAAAHVTDSRNRRNNTSDVIPRHSSGNGVDASSSSTAVTTVSSSNARDVPSALQDTRRPSDNSTNDRSALNHSLSNDRSALNHSLSNDRSALNHSLTGSAITSGHRATRTAPRAGSSPREAPVTTSPRDSSHQFIHVRETPRTAGGAQNGVERDAPVSAGGHGMASGQPGLHTVRETAEDVDHLDLV